MALPDVAPAVAAGKNEQLTRKTSWVSWWGMPIFLLAIGAATYFWVNSLDLDTIEERVLNQQVLTEKLVEHLKMVAISTAIVIAIAIPLGILLTRPFARRGVPVALGVANAGQ
ncbi:MAG: hypothetical protein WBP61_08015, partial [Nocardioides sp.]